MSSNVYQWSGTIDEELRQMSTTVKGCDLLNRAINALSIKLHISGYQFYGLRLRTAFKKMID